MNDEGKSHLVLRLYGLPPPPLAHQSATAGSETENVTMNQTIWESFQNSRTSINTHILAIVHGSEWNIVGFHGSKLCALGLEIEIENQLLVNLANFGTMNNAAQTVGNWITPIICHQAQENVRPSMESSQQWVGKLLLKQMRQNFLSEF